MRNNCFPLRTTSCTPQTCPQTLDTLGLKLKKDELQLREEVMDTFAATVVKWATKALELRGYGQLLTKDVVCAPEHIAQVQAYGSYRQGIHMPGMHADD